MSHSSEEPHHNENSNDHHKQQEQKKIHEYEMPFDYWQSPRQGPPSHQFPPPVPMFNLSHERFDDYDPGKMPPATKPHYPFRKHSVGDGQHMEPSDYDEQHKMPVPFSYGYYYGQRPPTMKAYPPPYMYPQQWPRQHPGMYPTPMPYFGMPYNEQQSYQNTVSKELQNKVFQIIQQTQVSQFQCNCKKSKCLKLYCECFAQGQVCSQSCNCQDCKNRIDNQQERSKAIEEALLRNNDAFHSVLSQKPPTYAMPIQGNNPFTLEQSKPTKEIKDPNQSKKGGCNCKKSGCKKKYCECYSANQICNELCKCENCQNKSDAQQQEQKLQNEDSPDNILDINIKNKSKKIKKEDIKQQVQLKVKIYNDNSSAQKKKKQN